MTISVNVEKHKLNLKVFFGLQALGNPFFITANGISSEVFDNPHIQTTCAYGLAIWPDCISEPFFHNSFRIK